MSEAAATIQMPQQGNRTEYTKAFERDGNDSLATFLRKFKLFEDRFVAHMFAGDDFTLRLEVRGNKHVMLHVRVYEDQIDRPDGAEARLDKSKKSTD